jgi:S-adenosylmethionine:tRNA ribosyltransferase-isomerase
MLISDYHFDLPSELIAQEPLHERQASRMLVVDRAAGTFRDAMFADLPELLTIDDILILNNTQVFPARLFGKTETGAQIEIFLVTEVEAGVWETLARPARRLSPGKKIIFDYRLTGEVVRKLPYGRVEIRFSASGDEFYTILDEIGKTPLPPYIKRERAGANDDRERYQTVFASNRGAIAAPTAGLHFTPDILEAISRRNIPIAEITLHVGYGTFEPVRAVELDHHTVAAEQYEISLDTEAILNDARAAGRRFIAIGTTTTRALESNISSECRFTTGKGLAELTITPGHKFRAVDALLTNFHLPQSSLLVLTSTFGGHELIMEAYRHAVAERYRFYSYGDCMLII